MWIFVQQIEAKINTFDTGTAGRSYRETQAEVQGVWLEPSQEKLPQAHPFP